ncbi:MAG: hypothetical protein FIB01_01560, partial [Gemmatimonadetes bacterium]|nr:hypothetical protein [Gemmatimonadota bacterium]
MAQSGTTVERPGPAGDGLGAPRAGAISLTGRWGPLLYGGLFVIALPLALVAWAKAVPGLAALPAIRSWPGGAALAVIGVLLWLAGVLALARRGGGLPMNAYPPPRYVSTGVYGWVRHPIYWGFLLATAGVVLMAGSRAGLWLVLQAVALATGALVLGYEGPGLRSRFGAQLPAPRLSLPPSGPAVPNPWDRLSVYLLVLLPWLLAWSAVQVLGVPADAVSSELALDRRVPVLEWTWLVYASAYLVVPLIPLLLASREELRRFTITGLVSTAVVLLCWLCLPLAYLPRPFTPTSFAGQLLLLDRRWCTGMAAFPSFHVLWALIAADALARLWPRARWWCWGWAAAVTVSCHTTGMHGTLDLLAALGLYPLVRDYRASWERLRGATERVANGWREWRFGPVREINHGLWGGLAGAAGLAAMRLLGADQPRLAALGSGVGGLVGAGIWAQVLESS